MPMTRADGNGSCRPESQRNHAAAGKDDKRSLKRIDGPGQHDDKTDHDQND